MLRLLIIAGLLAFALTSNMTFADSYHSTFTANPFDSLGKCVQRALAKKDGEILKVEYEVESKIPIYKFDIETPDGKAWEVECTVETSRITEVEEEVKAFDPRFTSQAKISVETAVKTALARHPGKVMEVEYGIEDDGRASYEVDIEEDDTEEVMVEIDAVTGKIIEIGYENYQIGVHQF